MVKKNKSEKTIFNRQSRPMLDVDDYKFSIMCGQLKN